MENIICGIYKITSPSGKVYIGQSKNIIKRQKAYEKLRCKKQTRLLFSLLKYGGENHTFEIIEGCLAEDLDCRERYWQDFYDVLSQNKGLNCQLTKCGEKRSEVSEDTKKKIGDFNRGKTISESHRKAVSAHFKGGTLSEEHKLKIGLAHKGRIIGEDTREKLRQINLGKNLTDKTKAKIAEKSREWHKNNDHPMKFRTGELNHNSKIVLNLQTGVFHNSAKEASIAYNINYSYLRSMLNGSDYNKTSLIYV